MRINGLSDIVATAFFSPAQSGRIIWGAGPVVLLPAATNNSIGTEKFGLGPSAVALTQPGNWTVGFLFNHIWSISGANDRTDVNQTFLQPFANYNTKTSVAESTSPIRTKRIDRLLGAELLLVRARQKQHVAHGVVQRIASPVGLTPSTTHYTIVPFWDHI